MLEELLPSFLCTALMRIGTRMAAVFDQHFAALGMTQAQFRLLLAVREEGGADGITPSLLAEHLLIERATVSVLTSRLIERGLLERKAGDNRRTFRLTLTKQGHSQLELVVPHAVALADETLDGSTMDELRQTLTLLSTLEGRLRARNVDVDTH